MGVFLRDYDNITVFFHAKHKDKLICLETLNIKAMARRWGRKVHSLGFYKFVEILKYEAQKFGTQIVFVDRYFPSSQLCSTCGYKNPVVKDLKIREWEYVKLDAILFACATILRKFFTEGYLWIRQPKN